MRYSFSFFCENRGYWGSKGAGILAIATDTGKWLVALRSERIRYEPRTWSNIGGKIDSYETSPAQAAKREFFEETKYNGPLLLHPAHVYQSPEKKETGESKFTYYNFIGEIIKNQWEPQLNWETSRFAWVSYQELIDLEPKHFGLSELLKESGELIHTLSRKYQNGAL